LSSETKSSHADGFDRETSQAGREGGTVGKMLDHKMKTKTWLGEKEVLINIRFICVKSQIVCDASMAVSSTRRMILSRKSWDIGKMKLLDAVRCTQPLVNAFLRRKKTREAILKIR